MKKNSKNRKHRKSSLADSARKSLLELNRIGTSKAEARAEYNAKLRQAARAAGVPEEEIAKMPFEASPYIHSYSTMSQYISISENFARWLEIHHPEVTKIQYAHKRHYDTEYIQMLIDAGKAPSTIARATSALAKLYRCSADDIHSGRPERQCH